MNPLFFLFLGLLLHFLGDGVMVVDDSRVSFLVHEAVLLYPSKSSS